MIRHPISYVNIPELHSGYFFINDGLRFYFNLIALLLNHAVNRTDFLLGQFRLLNDFLGSQHPWSVWNYLDSQMNGGEGTGRSLSQLHCGRTWSLLGLNSLS